MTQDTNTASGAADLSLQKRVIFDAIRSAYDLGYSDARNARSTPGDSAPGYKGRQVEADHGGALSARIAALASAPAQPVAEPAKGAVYAPLPGPIGLAHLYEQTGEPGANSRPSLEAVFRGLSDRAYCNYIEQMRRDVCLGWEHKVAQGKFGEPELKGHTLAAQQLGRHKAFSEAANALRGSDAPLTQPAAQDAERLIAAARHIADTATDLGEDFEVGSNAMASLSLALDEYDAAIAAQGDKT